MISVRRVGLRYLLNSIVLACGIALLVFIDRYAVTHRQAPPAPTAYFRVDRQSEVYGILKLLNVRGVHLLQVNRFFNLEESPLTAEMLARPFPIHARDIRLVYEAAGITSHNWLFVATRTGLVRRISCVLPDSVFDKRAQDLQAEPSFMATAYGFSGYSYDTPWNVYMLRSLTKIAEPAVAVIDAGFFIDGSAPGLVMSQLREKCPDIRIVVFVDSVDEPDITLQMRKALEAASLSWKESR